MKILKIISFVKYKNNYDYLDKCAIKIEEILKSFGLSKEKDYSMKMRLKDSLYVYIFYEKSKEPYLYLILCLDDSYRGIDFYYLPKKPRLILCLKDSYWGIDFYYLPGAPCLSLGISIDSSTETGKIEIYNKYETKYKLILNKYENLDPYSEYFEVAIILSNYFHFIRNFKEKLFKYLEKCYQDGSVNLEEFIRFLLKNINFFEEGKRALDKVKEVLDRNKEKIGGLEMIDFKELVIINTSKVFLSDYEDYITEI
jgi:hypothetical protein